MAKASQTAEVTLLYLPTAQHKAGLAGLLLLINSMRQRRLGPLPVVSDLTATTVTIMVSQASLHVVFDCLYDAELRDIESKTKWKGKDPKREKVVEVTDPKTGKKRKTKLFVYDAVVPKASFLAHHYPGDENGWLKLWRDMLW